MAISSALGATGAVPVGVVDAFAGSTAPSGWLLCYGQAVSRTQYPVLFNVLSTTYGAGDGSTTFNIPDMRGRAVAGKDDMGGSAASRITSGVTGITGTSLGSAGGTQNPPLHSHANTASFSGNAASHSHTIRNPSTGNQIFYMGNGASGFVDQWGQGGQGGLSAGTPIDNTSITPSGSVTMSNANAGTGTSGNVQPTIILNYIIKAQ